MSEHNPTLPSLENCVESIETEYARVGHKLGWRFLAGPRGTFTASTRFAFITPNPGGREDRRDHPQVSSEDGSVYWIESWKKGLPAGTAPLQRQVQELFARITPIVGANEGPQAFVETRVLTAYFVPFRSCKLPKLHRRKESIAFACRLWSCIFATWTPRVILTIGKPAFDNLRDIFEARLNAGLAKQFSTGHRNLSACKAEAYRFQMPERGEDVTLAGLPHLSQFPLMSIEACRQPVQEFLNYVFAPDSHGARRDH